MHTIPADVGPMTPDTTNPTDRFLRTILRSGLVSRDQLGTAMAKVSPEIRQDAARLAQYFVEANLLTQYQTSKLLQGAWQGLALGAYHILAPLGRGGMGTVYLARDSRHQRLVALKVLPPKRARQEERLLARFRREMDLAQRVSHPHLTQTYESGVHQGVYFLAMEYIRGVPLSKYVQDRGTLLVDRTARLFAEIAAGLQHAHDQGLIHRDLKPSNIMVTPNGHAKILDLGMALIEGETAMEDKSIIGGAGYILGTMDYIAPEQAADATNVSPRSDLYALGCTMYFALTGRPPFPGGTSLEKLLKHRDGTPEPITELNPTVSVDFALIVERLMAKRPERRFASANALREALLPWASTDVVRPMDVVAQESEAAVVQAVEAEHAREATVWESIPVIVFGDAAKKADTTSRPALVPEASTPEQTVERLPGVPTLLFIAGILAVTAMMLLLEFFRRW